MSAWRKISQMCGKRAHNFITGHKEKQVRSLCFSSNLICDRNERTTCSSQYNHKLLDYPPLKYKRYINTSSIANEREHYTKSESASYEGSGKTTVTILNEDVQYLMIDSISLSGFRLNTGLKAFGPMAVFPNAVLSWRVMDFLEVDERALSIFTIIEPKPDIVILGYGDRPVSTIRSPRLGYDIDEEKEEENTKKYRLTEKRNKEVAQHIAKLTLTMKQKRINLECLPTEDAVSAYNYLVSEDRLVAAALIPPNVVKMVSLDQDLTTQLAHGDDPWMVSRNQIFGDGQGESETTKKLKDWYYSKQT